MTVAGIAVDVLLFACVSSAALSACALIIMRNAFERLHYLSIVSTVSSFALLMAVVVKDGWGQATIKMIFTFCVLLANNAVLTHATARAARIREFGHWAPQPDERLPGAPPPEEREFHRETGEND